VGTPEVVFPALVMATGPVRALVIQAEILGLAFPVEAFLVENVAAGGDFVWEFRMVVERMVACQWVVVVVGMASSGVEH